VTGRIAALAAFLLWLGACQQPMPAQCPEAPGDPEMLEGLKPPPPDPSLVTLPNGAPGYVWECEWPLECLKRAGKACPAGYALLGVEEGKTAVVSGEAVSEANQNRHIWCAMAAMGGDPAASERCSERVTQDTRQQTAQLQREELLKAQSRKRVIVKCQATRPPAAPTDDVQEPLPELPPVVAAPAPAASSTPRPAP
jgi:hypothetical protein